MKPSATSEDLFGPPAEPETPAGPRPLADRLRPRSLDEVVGQDHLLGPDGTLTRMLARDSGFGNGFGFAEDVPAKLAAYARTQHSGNLDIQV